jgi:hypothetical protein
MPRGPVGCSVSSLIPDVDVVDGIENHSRPSTRSNQAMSGDRFPISVSPFPALPAMVSFLNPQPALSLGAGAGPDAPFRPLRERHSRGLSDLESCHSFPAPLVVLRVPVAFVSRASVIVCRPKATSTKPTFLT